MTAEKPLVVLVHGIWMNGREMGLLRHRFAACGLQTRQFRYPSVRLPPAENADALGHFIYQLNAETVHLVGHSLGGLVILHLLARYPELPPGRVLLLGSPVAGSGVAQRMSGLRLLSPFLGRSLEQGLDGGAPRWKGGRSLGVIAGTLKLGVGRLIGGIDGPNDGAVAVTETHITQASDTLILPVSHTGMLFSAEVARQACRFLRDGRFVHSPYSVKIP